MSKTKRRILHFLVTLNLIGLGTVGFIALTASKPHAQSGERRPECGHQSRLSALSIHFADLADNVCRSHPHAA